MKKSARKSPTPEPVISSGADTMLPVIRIRGARTHNLQNIDVDLPIGRLTVMTGVSGSGKSSLAINTLFAEGQRRYLESVAPQTRTLLSQLTRPEVDEISGLPPTVCLDQRPGTVPARSTLAVTTEIHDYLRLLYSRAGTVHCTSCGRTVTSQSAEQIVQRTAALPERTKLMILSPIVRNRRGAHKDVLDRIIRNGFVRARIDGVLTDAADAEPLSPSREHSIDVVIDRIVIKDGIDQRLRESVQLACRESGGTCMIAHQQGEHWVERLFSVRFCCPDCDLNFPTPEPRHFSFHSAHGACPDCRGFGMQGTVEKSGEEIVTFGRRPCPTCSGSRLQPLASGITFLGTSITQFSRQTVSTALQTVNEWETAVQEAVAADCEAPNAGLSREARLVALRLLPDIRQRLECLQQVGVGYLSLDRVTRTLSGGEYQRARLAACLGTSLHGACFVLDEPTAGLHPRDTARLIQSLINIRDRGSTVVVVEHDSELMQAADWLIDLGPGAGADGGQLLFAGTPADAVAQAHSPTADYLRSGSTISPADSADPDRWLTIRGARQNNLQNISVTVPLQRMVAVTGVSGSGKSTLIIDTLLPIALQFSRRDECDASARHDAQCDGIDGLEQIVRVVALDDGLPGRNSRSCVATVSGLWNLIRRLLTKTRESRVRGYGAERFSFNAGDGRCSECRGTGFRNQKMSFLPDAAIVCPACRGRRFNRATLEVRFLGHNAADLLDLRVDEAKSLFAEFRDLQLILQALELVGLGYLKLGQPASTFSGGEAQRVRLATELASPSAESTLYVLDEPTRGLHPADVEKLVRLLRGLVNAGHSVVVVEHNLDVIRASDWLIDLGPDSGESGGRVVYADSLARAMQTAATSPEYAASLTLQAVISAGTRGTTVSSDRRRFQKRESQKRQPRKCDPE